MVSFRAMNLITRDTDYAVRALCYMARKPEQVVSVTDLCAQLDMPRPYLRRVLQTLAREHILDSFRGQGGGFRLLKAPSGIMLTDLIETFQGRIDFTRCTFRASACRHQGWCPLRKKIKRIEKHAVMELRAATIASLVSGQLSREPRRNAPGSNSSKRKMK